jgi:hypothetical protein
LQDADVNISLHSFADPKVDAEIILATANMEAFQAEMASMTAQGNEATLFTAHEKLRIALQTSLEIIINAVGTAITT